MSNVHGEVDFHVLSHSGTHSIYPPGDTRLWGEPAEVLEKISVPSVTLDEFCFEHRLDHIDILGMDIQGGELDALEGAFSLLSASKIDLIRIEVVFLPLYDKQPLFWDIGSHLSKFSYQFYGLYDCHYHQNNTNSLV